MTEKSNNQGLGELHPKEVNLLRRLREKHQWGTVTIEMRSGLPNRLVKVVEYRKM